MFVSYHLKNYCEIEVIIQDTSEEVLISKTFLHKEITLSTFRIHIILVSLQLKKNCALSLL